MRQELPEAIRLYRESLAVFPTAEAHTFLGWALSWQGDVDGAIRECERAIVVDPDFGNPYNDIAVEAQKNRVNGIHLDEVGYTLGAVSLHRLGTAEVRFRA